MDLAADLPGYTEQEIVVVDLAGPPPQTVDRQPDLPAVGVRAMWAPTAAGLIDPRPAVMWRVRNDMDRIYKHGGIFILFAAKQFDPGYLITSRNQSGLDMYGARQYEANNWCLLPDLTWLSVIGDSGQEMDCADNGLAQTMRIANYFSSGYFECAIKPTGIASQWATLAVNKYGDPVSGIIYPSSEDGKQASGLVFIFPNVERRAELVTELLERILPTLRPRLFPLSEGSRWTRRPEYDLLQVTVLKNEIVRLEGATRTRVRELEEQIEAERAQYGFMHDLLTATGDDLVQAVIHALKTIGFNDVHDVDADARSGGDVGPLREDVRIMDAPVPVLVEVKGVFGTPKEASSLQVAKYLIPRMREWKRHDLHGLSIVNHQRGLPALEREHEHVFQPDVLSACF